MAPMNHDPRSGGRSGAKRRSRRFRPGSPIDRSGVGGPAHGVLPSATSRVLRPTSLVLALGGLYGAGALAVALTAIFADVEEFVSGFVFWGTMWLVPGVPCASAIALVGWSSEPCRDAGGEQSLPPDLGLVAPVRRHPDRVPLGGARPVGSGVGRRDDLQPHAADRYLPLALFALVPWLLAAGGMILALGGRRLLTLDDPNGAARPVHVVVGRADLRGGGYACALSAVLPAAVWLAWLESAWYRGAGATGVLGWMLLGVALAMLAGGATGAWLVAAAPVAPWTTGRPGLRQLEVAGAVFTAHWVAPLVFALSPMFRQNDDLRYIVALLSSSALVAGTALGLFARTWRTRDPGAGAAGAPTPS